MADTDTTLNIMLFEGGALINALSDKQQAVTLATKIEHADRNAFAAGQTSFDLVLDPIEVGMALDALTNTQGTLTANLGKKLSLALGETMKRLGVSYDESPQQGGLGQDTGALTSPAPEPEPEPEQQLDESADAPAEEQPQIEEDPDAL